MLHSIPLACSVLLAGCLTSAWGHGGSEEPFPLPFPHEQVTYPSHLEVFEITPGPGAPGGDPSSEACVGIQPGAASPVLALAGIAEWAAQPAESRELQVMVQDGEGRTLQSWTGTSPLRFELDSPGIAGANVLVRAPGLEGEDPAQRTVRLEVVVAYAGAEPPTVALSSCDRGSEG